MYAMHVQGFSLLEDLWLDRTGEPRIGKFLWCPALGESSVDL